MILERLTDYFMGNQIGFFSKVLDRVKYFCFYIWLYKLIFASYGKSVRWGKHGSFLCKPSSIRINNYKKIHIHDGVQIDEHVYIQSHDNCDRIEIGAYSRINFGVHIQAYNGILIGAKSLIAPYVHISNSNHGFTLNKPIMEQEQYGSGLIKLGEGSWLGHSAQILGGVELASNSVVAAGAVVTRSFKQKCVVAGVPAVIKKLL